MKNLSLNAKISFIVSLIFTVLFGVSTIIIYISFDNFRKNEFKERMTEKAVNTLNLLVHVKEIDAKILKTIDINSIYRLYDEKTIIFDSDYNLIYSSIDDGQIDWKSIDINTFSNSTSNYISNKGKETLYLTHILENNKYYLISTAIDKYGYTKLEYLKKTLIVVYFSGLFILIFLNAFFVRLLLKPLQRITEIIKITTEEKLENKIEEIDQSYEIKILTQSFNDLLSRIYKAFSFQKDFASNVSHELRTPLTRLMLMTENSLNSGKLKDEEVELIKKINIEIKQMSELISSLLMFASMNSGLVEDKKTVFRIDSTIFNVFENISKSFPDTILKFDIEETNFNLEYKGIESLIGIALENLIKNAALYSTDKIVKIIIIQNEENCIEIKIKNTGNPLMEGEEKQIFDSFKRGSNSKNKLGSGLGLRIVKQIIELHDSQIDYSYDHEHNHVFSIKLKYKINVPLHQS